MAARILGVGRGVGAPGDRRRRGRLRLLATGLPGHGRRLFCGGRAGHMAAGRISSRGLPAAVAAGEQEPTHRRVGDHAGVVALLASLFFLYVGVETASGQWPYSELTTARGVSGAAAGLGVSLYWSALAGGRIARGVFGNRISVRGLLDLSVGTAAVGAVGFWLAPPLVSTLVALPLIGLALAPIFPLFTVVTKELIGAGATTRAIGYQTAVGIA